mgnify:CR=1 FL=1
MSVETTRRVFRIDRRQISFVKFILEAYDNVAVMSTLDPQQAIVQITSAPNCQAMVDGIIRSFSGEFEMIPVDIVSSDGTIVDANRLPPAGHGSMAVEEKGPLFR